MTAEEVVEEAIQGTLHEAMDVYIPDCTFVATEVLAALKAAGFVVATRDEIRAMSATTTGRGGSSPTVRWRCHDLPGWARKGLRQDWIGSRLGVVPYTPSRGPGAAVMDMRVTTVPTRMDSAMTVSGDWCPATLADKGRVPCTTTTIHDPHRGCRFELIDADVNRDHEEDTR